MSSMGGQWRVIRHYLSNSALNAELEKLVQRVKPATAEQWDNFIKRIDKVLSARITSNAQEEKLQIDTKINTTAVEGADSKPATQETQQSKAADVPAPSSPTIGSDYKITVNSILQGLWLKKDIQLGKISERSWKEQKRNVTKSSVHARTAYVISALAAARSGPSALARTEALLEHLHAYPEARDHAIKEGAVRALLRAAEGAGPAGEELAGEGQELAGAVREALALLGHAGAPRGPGAAVLALDGGGVRGLVAIEVLQALEALAGRPVTQLFDLVAGVSTGAIVAGVLARGGSLAAARALYRQLCRDAFRTTRLAGGARLVLTHGYYDTARWERLLREHLGEASLAHTARAGGPRLALVSCVASGAARGPFVFRSYSAGWRLRSVFPGSARARLWQAVRASAAAPTYFDEFRLDGLLHQDGGLMVNNPTGIAVHEAKLLYGAEALRRGTVVSVGTGRAPAAAGGERSEDAPSSTSWKDKFNKILDSATDTEGVHLVMNDLLPHGSYFRFNPPLLDECAMDEVDERKLDSLSHDTQAYIRRNRHKFEEAAARLTRRRTLAQQVCDHVAHRALLAGLRSPR